MYRKYAEAHTARNLKVFRKDKGIKNLSNDLRYYLSDLGIKNRMTVEYNPQKNEVVERMNRTVITLNDPSCTTRRFQSVSGPNLSLLLCRFVTKSPLAHCQTAPHLTIVEHLL